MLKINKWNKHLVTLQLDIGSNKNTDVNDLNRGSKTFLRRSYQVFNRNKYKSQSHTLDENL